MQLLHLPEQTPLQSSIFKKILNRISLMLCAGKRHDLSADTNWGKKVVSYIQVNVVIKSAGVLYFTQDFLQYNL